MQLRRITIKCSPEINLYDATFCSVLAVNIVNYGSLPKIVNLASPELMRNTDYGDVFYKMQRSAGSLECLKDAQIELGKGNTLNYRELLQLCNVCARCR